MENLHFLEDSVHHGPHFGSLECVDLCSRRRECQELSNCHYFYGTHYVIYNQCLFAFCAVYVLKDVCCSNQMSEASHQSGWAICQRTVFILRKKHHILEVGYFLLMYILHKQQATTSLWIMETVCLVLSVYWKRHFIDHPPLFLLRVLQEAGCWVLSSLCLEYNMKSKDLSPFVG